MRESYDIKNLNPRKNPYSKELKQQITIKLSQVVIEYFKSEAEETGIPYQTLINLYLSDCVKEKRKIDIKWNKASWVFFCSLLYRYQEALYSSAAVQNPLGKQLTIILLTPEQCHSNCNPSVWCRWMKRWYWSEKHLHFGSKYRRNKHNSCVALIARRKWRRNYRLGWRKN